MNYIFILCLVIPAAFGQTGTASIAGTVLDAKTKKPVPAALVMAVKSAPPSLARNTRSGGDGAFQIQGLAAGTYSVCVQAQGDAYLDPCHWSASPTTVTLVSGQAAAGVSVRLTAASVLNVEVRDPQKVLSQMTKDGRRPALRVGVSGPNGMYYPAHGSRSPGVNLEGGIVYRLAIPRDTALKLYVAGQDVKLGDATGAALPGNTSQQTFQQATSDPIPKSFTFTVLGLLP